MDPQHCQEGQKTAGSGTLLKSNLLVAGVDYIQGEVMWMKKHRKYDNQEDMLNYEAHIFLPDSRCGI
jgi:hypothetical protein